MSQVKVCNESAHLQELLEGALPPDRQVALTSHLDTCAVCQQTLEGMASGAASWNSPAGLPTENDSPEPALQRLMSELKKKASEAVTQVGPVAAAAASLEFLGPAKQPGHLG